MPDSLTEIGHAAFTNCDSLQTISTPFAGSTREDTQTAFSRIYGYADLPRTVAITDATQIPDDAFRHYTVHSVSLNDAIRSIGDRAFADCGALETISLPASLETIGEFAFYGCLNLQKLDLPDGLREIGGGMLIACRLTEITLPASLTYIGPGALTMHPLERIVFRDTQGWSYTDPQNPDSESVSVPPADLQDAEAACKLWLQTQKTVVLDGAVWTKAAAE